MSDNKPPVKIEGAEVLGVVTRVLRDFRSQTDASVDKKIEPGIEVAKVLRDDLDALRESLKFVIQDNDSIRAESRLQEGRWQDHVQVELGKLFDATEKKASDIGERIDRIETDSEASSDIVRSAFESVDKEVRQLKEELHEELDRLESGLASLSANGDDQAKAYKDLFRRVDGLDHQTAALNAEFETFCNTLSELTETVDNFDLDTWKVPLQELDARLSRKSESVDKRLEAHNSWISKLLSENGDTAKDFEKLSEFRIGTEKHIQKTETRFLGIGEQIEDLDSELARLQENRKNLSDEIFRVVESSNRDGERFDKIHTELLDRFSDVDSDIAEISGTIISERENLKASVTALREYFSTGLDAARTYTDGIVEDSETRQSEKLRIALEPLAPKEDFVQVQERIAAVDSRVTEESIASVELMHASSKDLMETLRETRAELEARHTDLENDLDKVSKIVPGLVAKARDWISGPPYPPFSAVKHRAGTWVSAVETEEEPGEGGHWQLVADGIWTTEVQRIDDSTDFELHLTLSSGNREAFRIKGYDPVHRGTWKADSVYRRLDVVMRDGHSWIATRANPTGDPTKSEDWRMLAMRGARGRKGDKGDLPDMDDVIRAYTDYMMEGDGTAILRFRGRWQLQEPYQSGDIVVFGTGLHICTSSNDGSVPPSGPAPGEPSSDWAVFFAPPSFRGLTRLEADPTPTLGGDLRTKGNVIRLTTADDAERAAIGEYVSLDGDAAFFAFVGENGVYEDTDGAMVVKAGRLEAHGASFYISAFDKPGSGPMQLYVSDNGLIYGVEPPAPGWEVSDTDAGDYDLGTGTSQGPWVQMAGLSITVPEDTPNGVRIDVFANVDTVNKTATRDGTMDVGFGINGAQPSSQSNYSIPAGFDGYVPVSLTTTTHGGLTTGDTIHVWARRASGSHGQFGVDLIGSDGDLHELIVSKPSA